MTAPVQSPRPLTLDEFRQALDLLYAKQTGILIDKRRSYGTGNLTRRGGLAILIRIDDKLSRLETMLTNRTDTTADGESIRDALRDVIGYATLGLLWLDGYEV